MNAPHDARPADPARDTPGVVRRSWRWGVVALYAILIFIASSFSGVSIPRQVSDKQVHGVVYAVLSVLVLWASIKGEWRHVRGKHVMAATAVCALYGLSDEFHQRFVPGRDYDLRDLGADAVGACGAAVVVWAWSIIQRGRTQPHSE